MFTTRLYEGAVLFVFVSLTPTPSRAIIIQIFYVIWGNYV